MAKKMSTIFILLLISTYSLYGFEYKSKPPYPIIFVHGLTGSDNTFIKTMEKITDWGTPNVFDVVLEADDDTESSLIVNDVKWQNFSFNGRDIKLGKRQYAKKIKDYVFNWSKDSYIFAINFKEERIAGAANTWNDYFDYSDQSAIYKQGYALGKMIKEVLDFTGAEKVILVGHSMGGLCIREYLQRTDTDAKEGKHCWWVDPLDYENGHKVARVTTIGTPHLGSNLGIDPTPSNENEIRSKIPNKKSAAMRDLKYSYDAGYPGIYLFGGNESDIADAFWSNDINCNGSSCDEITGINSIFRDNPLMPLPLNIKYTWIVSNSGILEGDGCVEHIRQWLQEDNKPVPQESADTLMISVNHWDEGSYYYGIVKGFDEPKEKKMAYKIDLNKDYSGRITKQTNNDNKDEDIFVINDQIVDGMMSILIEGDKSHVEKIKIFSDDKIFLEKNVNFNNNIFKENFLIENVSENVYLQITGNASYNTWKYPYSFRMQQLENNIDNYISQKTCLCSNYPNPFNNSTSISFYLDQAANISIDVYNIKGEKVANLFRGFCKSGTHSRNFEASNVASGVLYYILSRNNVVVDKKKMLFIK